MENRRQNAETPASNKGDAAFDAQRGALHELIDLLTRSAETQQRIDARLATETRSADRALSRGEAEIASRYEQDAQQIEQEHEQRVQQLRQQAQAELSEAVATSQNRRQRIEFDADSAEQEVKQKLQQAVWLAESVYEGTFNHAHTQYKKTEEKVRVQVEALDAIDQQAAKLLAEYQQDVPAEPEPAPEAEAAQAQPTAAAEAEAAYEAARGKAHSHLVELQSLAVPRLFVGFRPYLIVVLLLIIAGVVAQGISGSMPSQRDGLAGLELKWQAIFAAVGGTLAVCLLAGFGLWFLARRQVRRAYRPLRSAALAARRAAENERKIGARERDALLSRARRKRDLEVGAAKERFSPQLERARKNRRDALQTAEGESGMLRGQIEHRRDQALQAAQASHQSTIAELQRVRDDALASARQQHHDATASARQAHDAERATIEKQWEEGLRRIQEPIHGQDNQQAPAPRDWNDPAWAGWTPPRSFASQIRFGQMKIDLAQVTQNLPGAENLHLKLPDSFAVPAVLAFPSQASLLIQSDGAGRDASIRAMQMVMARLLTNLPAGRVHFTIVDPIGLGQNFAGFMHLADHDEALVGTRIWTDADQIDQRLRDLTEHMETVIQKYLRNEYQTIDEYNAQAGELAEPYRYLVIADFPHNFSPEAIRRLNSIASTGARCGVYTLIMRDTREPLTGGAHIDEVERHSVHLLRKDDRFIWNDDVFRQFPLELDPAPGEAVLTRILEKVGRHAKEARRVEVPFEQIAPALNDGQVWSAESSEELRVPIGRLGATRQQVLRLGRGVAQHGLIAGKTGSGKSTLLHVLVTNLALWYPPDEVQFYLVDFKKGVEFKTYATHHLPHARAIAVESDREFGLSVLQRVDAELSRRGALFREAGVQDLPGYRRQTKQKLPRILLIIDEFQEFFTEDDKLAQDAGLLLDRLVRQGRAFGIHLLLGSQTIGGTSGLARSTLGQMAVRIALQTSEADAHLILSDNNSAARLLSRPGEAIYNDAGGLVEANSPFQVAWLPDAQRERFLQVVQQRQEKAGRDAGRSEPPIVFEGNMPADIRENRRLGELLEQAPSGDGAAVPAAARAWLGEPVAIKEPTSIAYRRQSGANALIIGQQEESALALMVSSIISLAAQYPPGKARFYVLDGTPADSTLHGTFGRLAGVLPPETLRLVEFRGVDDAVDELHTEMTRRLDEGAPAEAPSLFLVVYGLQRYRVLRKSEDAFSFSMNSDEEEKPRPRPDKQFADLLRDGAGVGIHVIAWIDTSANIERTLDRASLREFDHRVLFQMSANDSSNLIDSPAANKLGFYRALAYSEEQGVTEKFRPYALPDPQWLEQVKRRLGSGG